MMSPNNTELRFYDAWGAIRASGVFDGAPGVAWSLALTRALAGLGYGFYHDVNDALVRGFHVILPRLVVDEHGLPVLPGFMSVAIGANKRGELRLRALEHRIDPDKADMPELLARLHVSATAGRSLDATMAQAFAVGGEDVVAAVADGVPRRLTDALLLDNGSDREAVVALCEDAMMGLVIVEDMNSPTGLSYGQASRGCDLDEAGKRVVRDTSRVATAAIIGVFGALRERVGSLIDTDLVAPTKTVASKVRERGEMIAVNGFADGYNALASASASVRVRRRQMMEEFGPLLDVAAMWGSHKREGQSREMIERWRGLGAAVDRGASRRRSLAGTFELPAKVVTGLARRVRERGPESDLSSRVLDSDDGRALLAATPMEFWPKGERWETFLSLAQMLGCGAHAGSGGRDARDIDCGPGDTPYSMMQACRQAVVPPGGLINRPFNAIVDGIERREPIREAIVSMRNYLVGIRNIAGHDVVDALSLTGLYRKMRRYRQALHAVMLKIARDSIARAVREGHDMRWVPLLPNGPQTRVDTALGSVHVREISDAAALCDEGERMRHCAAEYACEALEGASRFYHLEDAEGNPATMEISLSPASRDVAVSRRVHVGEFRGYANRTPSAANIIASELFRAHLCRQLSDLPPGTAFHVSSAAQKAAQAIVNVGELDVVDMPAHVGADEMVALMRPIFGEEDAAALRAWHARHARQHGRESDSGIGAQGPVA